MSRIGRTRRRRSYTLHTVEELAEGQSRRSGGASEDWGWRGSTSGGPGLMDIEEARRRSLDCRDLHYAVPVQHTGPHHSTAPNGARREMPAGRSWIGLKAETHGGRDAGRVQLDWVEGRDSRRTGPSRTIRQDVPLEIGPLYSEWKYAALLSGLVSCLV